MSYYIGYFPIVMRTHHNQKCLPEASMWAFGSRRKIVHHDREAWQQAGGTAAEQEAERAHLQPQAPSREKELKVG